MASKKILRDRGAGFCVFLVFLYREIAKQGKEDEGNFCLMWTSSRPTGQGMDGWAWLVWPCSSQEIVDNRFSIADQQSV